MCRSFAMSGYATVGNSKNSPANFEISNGDETVREAYR